MPGGWEWLIIIGVLVLLFGAKRLPDAARSLGRSMRIFKSEVKEMRTDDESAPPPLVPPREVQGRIVDRTTPAETTRPVSAAEQVDRDR